MRPFVFAGLAALLGAAAGCATTVEGNERALYFSASHGMSREPVDSGVYWHWPWNDYYVYDLRWSSHKEQIHIHSKDNLHMEIDVVVTVRPNPAEIYALHTDVGPGFYPGVVQPAVLAAVRDATGKFNHLEIATQTHLVELAIHDALIEHLHGKHIELSEVAIQHFDLPQEVEIAANRRAGANQLLGAKDVELALAERDAKIDQERKRGALEAQGLEARLRGEQELATTERQIQIEETKRKAELEKAKAEAEAMKVRSEAEAHAIRVRADAEKARIQALSQNLSPNYVRIQALDALGKAMGGDNTKMLVMPVGKDGLPAFWNPFLNPFGNLLGPVPASDDRHTRAP